jgi:hypothetical protein
MSTLKLAEVIHAPGGAILEGPTVDELIAKNMEVVRRGRSSPQRRFASVVSVPGIRRRLRTNRK